MNKKFKNLFLAGALVLGLAGVAVSCTDYDSDINNLKKDIDNVNGTVQTLSQQVQTLQNAINAGAVITNVSALSGEPGGWEFTLSDGKKYQVSNGAKGANGNDGTPGSYYTPNEETGCWDLHEYKNGKWEVTDTEQSYLPKNGTTLTYDPDANVLTITVGEDSYEVNLTPTGETALVFIPQCYIDGVEGFQAVTFFYDPLFPTGENTSAEIWAPKKDADQVQISPAKAVQFHVNVSDFELDDTFTYEFINKDDKPFIVTRGPQSEDFNVIPTFKSYEDGVLSLNVEIVGKEATAELITTMALKVSKDGKSVVSDYFTLLSGVIENLRIADPKEISKAIKGIDDEHYRRGTVGISNPDSEDKFRPTQLVWNLEGNDDLDVAHNTCDTAVAYTSTLDLKTITLAHYTYPDDSTCYEMTAQVLKEDYNLDIVYEVVLGYEIGKPVTPQDKFVELNDGVFTPKVYDVDGTAAIGRTPIIRVKIMDGSKVVEVAYIKVFIKQTPDGPNPQFDMIPKRDAKDDGENIFRFDCDGDMLITTVKDMNKIIYNGMNMSKDQFHELYDTLIIAPQKDTIGTVRDSVVDPVEGTHVIVWEMTADDMWDHSGESVAIVARYMAKNNNKLFVDVNLTATVEEIGKSLDLTSAKGDYIYEYWEPEINPETGEEGANHWFATKYNVNVAAKDDTNPDNCQFENDINASFKTDEVGKLKVENVDSVVYFFCEEVKDIKYLERKDQKHVLIKDIDGNPLPKLYVKFEVKDSTILMASITDDKGTIQKDKDGNALTDTVAVIVNTPTEKGETKVWNMFKWVKGKTVADTLLNTNDMYTYIGAKAFLCTANEDVETKELKVNFNGEDHFRANILQPVFINTLSADKFVDAVDFGEKYSYVEVDKLLDPFDWRARMFKDYKNYWDYYGPFDVVIDVKNALCDLNKSTELIPVPATIILNQVKGNDGTEDITVNDPISGVAVKLPGSKSGYLTYKNNGTNVTDDFHIYVKAKVGYGFGYIDSDWIEIRVEKTIGQ